MPTCSPSGPTRRTSGTRIRSLMRGSVMASPLLLPGEESRPPDAGEDEGPVSVVLTGPTLRGARARGSRAPRPTGQQAGPPRSGDLGVSDDARWERAPLGQRPGVGPLGGS